MGWETILIFGAFIALMYFLMVRPQKKRADEQKSLLNALAPGARVLLSSGIIGTVRAMGDTQLVVELAPGTDVTVLKQVVVKTMKPEDEEFEYADETPAVAAPAGEMAYGSLTAGLDGASNPALWTPDAAGEPPPEGLASDSVQDGQPGPSTHQG